MDQRSRLRDVARNARAWSTLRRHRSRALPQTEECRVYSSDTLLYIESAQHSTYADATIVRGAILTRGAKDKNGKSLGEAVKLAGEAVRVHGSDIAVDAIYS